MVCPACVAPPYCCIAYTAIQGTAASGTANEILLTGMKEKMPEFATRLKAKRIRRSLKVVC